MCACLEAVYDKHTNARFDREALPVQSLKVPERSMLLLREFYYLFLFFFFFFDVQFARLIKNIRQTVLGKSPMTKKKCSTTYSDQL